MAVYTYDPSNDKLNLVAGGVFYADAPVGFIGAFDAEEVPDGWLIFNGQTVLRSDYPDLWARANRNGQVGVDKFFSQGDGSTTFTLADLRETSLKGYGETSRSVGAHVKSGGLGIGEFIDDQLQNHGHANEHIQDETGNNYGHVDGGNWNFKVMTTFGISGARVGATTEVKAVGVVWAVKAKLTGLPIDLKAEVEKIATKFPDYTNRLSISGSPWTAPEDVYVVYSNANQDNNGGLTIDGVLVSTCDNDSGRLASFVHSFSGYVKKGQILAGGGLSSSQNTKVFTLI